jgi:hypothetical protein
VRSSVLFIFANSNFFQIPKVGRRLRPSSRRPILRSAFGLAFNYLFRA